MQNQEKRAFLSIFPVHFVALIKKMRYNRRYPWRVRVCGLTEKRVHSIFFFYGYLCELDGGFMNHKFFSSKNVTTLSVLMALVIVLQALGGSISFGGVTLNFTLIPIVLGAIVLGPVAGAFLGFASGVVVLIQVILAPAGFYYLIWTQSPFVTTMICLWKTTVAGFAAGWLFSLLKKKNQYVAIFVASGIVPIINTALFILGCLCVYDTIAIASAGANVFTFILVGLVTFNFFFEFAINLLVSPALHTVYRVVEKQFRKRR